MQIRPRRSVLYVSGANARSLEKARTLEADAFIFDLEDSVSPDLKSTARQQVFSEIKKREISSRESIIRINSFDSPWGEEDLAMAIALPIQGILLPKIKQPQDILEFESRLKSLRVSQEVHIWVMMETPQAILNAESIARLGQEPQSRLRVFILGTNDLAKETRVRLTPDRSVLLPWLSFCLLAARAYGLDMIDGVFQNFRDSLGFQKECEQGRDLGMDGKTLIHPLQIDLCNSIFSPSLEEIAWSQKVVDAFAQPENKGKGVIGLEGQMVERLHEEIAQRVLSFAAFLQKK